MDACRLWEKTRGFFAKHTNPKYLIDFAGVKIFDNATVDTNILIFGKEQNEYQTRCAVTDKLNKDSLKNLSDFVQQQHTICNFSDEDSWVILSPIEQSIKQKIESVGTPLKDWDIKIYRGVLTGYNDAFIISTEKRDEILANCQQEMRDCERLNLYDRFFVAGILKGMDMNGQIYGSYIFHGIFLTNLMKVSKVLLLRQKKHLKSNILPYIHICHNIRNLYLKEIRLKQESDTNGTLCRDGVLSIGRILISQKSCTPT